MVFECGIDDCVATAAFGAAWGSLDKNSAFIINIPSHLLRCVPTGRRSSCSIRWEHICNQAIIDLVICALYFEEITSLTTAVR